MKGILLTLSSLLLLGACVPAKKYNELVEKEKTCSEELAKYKMKAIQYEGETAELTTKSKLLQKEVDALREERTQLTNKYNNLQVQYDKLKEDNEILEKSFNTFRSSGAEQTALLHADLEAKSIELQRKEDALMALESKLQDKEQALQEREQRVNELEEIIRRKDAATAALKKKVADALIGFKNKGLSVEEKDGKIYVSLEAKLLFASGSTKVEAEGKRALVELGQVLEDENDLEIIVEGHTDTDKLAGTKHPKNNWELSVLRATSVIEILLQNSVISPKQLMAGGRSEFHPVSENDKAKNRRIEIILSPNLNELWEVIGEKK